LTNLQQPPTGVVSAESRQPSESGDTEALETGVPEALPPTEPNETSRSYVAFVIAVGVLAVVFAISVVVGLGGGSDDAVNDASPIDAFLQPAERARISYELDDNIETLRNGATFTLSDDLQLEVLLSPYPPIWFDIDVDLRLTTTDDEPVDDATISTTWDMDVMPHGPYFTEFVSTGDGQYSATFDYEMFGAWWLDLHISHPTLDSPDEVSLIVYVWPE
jgi:hypothetical protein